MSVGGGFLIDGKTCPLWVTSFPAQGILECLRDGKENRMRARTHWFAALLSTMDRMRSSALSPCHLTALQWWPQSGAVSQTHLPLFSCSCLSEQQEVKPREIKLQQRSHKRYVRTSHPTECTVFSEAYEICWKTDHILGHKSSLTKYKRIKITSCVLSNQITLKLEISSKKNYRNGTNM